MKSVAILSLILLCFPSMLSAQGTLEGVVFKMESNVKTPLAFVSIYSLDSKLEFNTRSDFDGRYSMTLPVGEHKIVFKQSGLQSDTISVLIENNISTSRTVELFEPTLGIVNVTAKSNNDNGGAITSTLATKDDDKVTTNKTRKELENTGAGDMGEATNKITGLSTVGSVLYVRGLGDRYNVVYLNQLPLPSPDPDFRVVPLSLFPTDIVSSISVSKVMSSELYGDFSGGAFNITSRSYFEKPTLKVSLGTGYNSITTFKDFKAYQGGKFDYFGFDDGTRQIPEFVTNNSNASAFPAINGIYPNTLYNSVEGRSTGFKDNFGVKTKTAQPFSNFSISAGNFKPFKKSDQANSNGYGFMALLAHDNKSNYSYGSIKNVNAQSEERLNYNVYKYNVSTSSTALFNLYFRFSPNHNLSFNSLYVNTSNDETRETWGRHFDYPRNVYSRRLTYKQNYMSVNQIIGTHKFLVRKEDPNFARFTLDWRSSYNVTGSQEPDRRQFVAFYDEGNEGDTEHYQLNYIDRNENHRFFSKLYETELSGKLNSKLILKYQETKDHNGNVKFKELVTLNIGADYKSKHRSFDYKQFNYVLNNLASNYQNGINIYDMNTYLSSDMHDQGQFYIQEVANFGSSYIATLDVLSAYTSAKFAIKNLEIIPGVRYEMGSQTVINRNQTTPSQIDKTILDNNSILPSLITKYSISNKDILRFVVSKTLTRPKFNELAPFQYTLFFAGVKAQGNPALLNSVNYNADLRYERYPKPGEMITIGGFYKYLDKPIEQTQLATASGQLMSFSNAMFAHVAGAEFEYVRNLSFLVSKEKRDSSFLKNIGIGFNVSYMFTSVQIDTTDLGAINTNSVRPLEGASPYLINFDLRYEKNIGNTGRKYLFAFAYNVFGPRLYSVGSNGIGDQYALPVNTLNFIARIDINKQMSIGFKAKNILNPSVRIVQQDMRTGYTGQFVDISTFKKGLNLSMSFSYNFNFDKTPKLPEEH